MKRLLCIVGGMNAGGAETFLMKVYRTLDTTKYQMDFAVAIKDKGYYDDEILERGGRIYHITPKSEGMVDNFISIKKLVSEEHYDCVLRTSQHSLSALELYASKLGGASERAFRSSNSNTVTGSKKEFLLHKICLFMPRMFANTRLAPSSEAADYMFGKRSVQRGLATLVHNGIDLNAYCYDQKARISCRRGFELENNLVIGHIGRFNQQKNHRFLLEIFKRIKDARHDSVLLLVGTGELETQIREQASELGIKDSVIFTGVRSDVPKLLSAMDVFVFPSFYEGMPNTVIEAQATGLPCVIADTITREADITGLVQYLPLSDSADKWAEAAIAAAQTERTDTKEAFLKNGYDIESVAKQFCELVFDGGTDGSAKVVKI